MSYQGRILLFDALADVSKLFLHLSKFQIGNFVPVLNMLGHTALWALFEVASDYLQFFVGHHLIDKQVSSVVQVELHDAPVLLSVGQAVIKQLDEHGQVVTVLWVQALALTHFLIVKDVTSVLVEEVVVSFREELDFHDFGTFLRAL